MLAFLKSLFGPGIPRIDPAEAVARAARGEVTLIDVREADELRGTGKAKGALNIPLSQIAARTNPQSGSFERKIARDKPIVLYCATGARSGMAGRKVVANGFAEVFNMGNLADWQRAGGKVVR